MIFGRCIKFSSLFKGDTGVLEFVEFEARLQGIEELDHLYDHRIYFQINDFGPTTTQNHQYQKHKFHVCYILCILDMVDFFVVSILIWSFILNNTFAIYYLGVTWTPPFSKRMKFRWKRSYPFDSSCNRFHFIHIPTSVCWSITFIPILLLFSLWAALIIRDPY